MGSYKQSCPCRGRVLSAARDCERYGRETQDLSLAIMSLTAEQVDRRDPTIGLEIQRLDQDRARARRSRNNAYSRLLTPEQPCPTCEGRGYRETPGLISGFDRRPSNVQRAEKVS